METFLFIIACQLVSFLVLYLLLKKRLDKQYSHDAQIGKIEKEVEKIITELNRTTERNIGILENKILEIENLMTSTDKRLGVLKRESEKHDLSQKIYANLAPSTANNANRDIKAEVMRLYESGFPSGMIANQLGASIGEVELIISLAGKG
jgi:hypothetical protein